MMTPIADLETDREIARAIAQPRRFRPRGSVGEVLAIEPQAIDFSYLYVGCRANERTDAGIAIVTVNGPLEHHSGSWWDSYEAIASRIEAAMSGEDVVMRDHAKNWYKEDYEPIDATPAKAVVLRIDSPGGEAAGAMWVHRKVRALSEAYGCPVYAYADEMACSAAYSLASAADQIWLPDTGQVGSIGVIATLFDRTKQNEQTGLRVELLTSGEYKADNHADRVIDDGIRERMGQKVMKLAGVFFRVVSRARSRVLGVKISPDAVESLQAGVFVGQDAVDAGIADGVATWGAFLQKVTESLSNTPGIDAPPGAAS